MLNYNGGAAASSIDGPSSGTSQQFVNLFWMKKAIITARREQFFMPLASVANMPKNYGKTMKVYEYVPLLDIRNVNDQGLDASGATIANGNLYGSSKDIGTITSKLPTLTENGGRVNRVGFRRLERTGTLFKFGFFMEFTQESMDFDTDDQLMEYLSTELMNGAMQLTEAVLQRDLLAGAGLIIYAGAATSQATVSGEANRDKVTYATIMRLDQALTDNRTPKQTKVITGSRMIDTKTIQAARMMFVGPALVPMLKGMVDSFGNKAFIHVQQYGDAGTIMNGEIGTIDAFRIIEVPEMLSWAGAGATVVTNPGYRATAGRYDVFPMLVVGDDSFCTIGFQTDGKTVKFTVMTKMPGMEMATVLDPYGETGFSSIKWYYGILIKRAERIGLIKTIAPV